MIESPSTGNLMSAIAYHGHYGGGVMLQLDEEIGSAVFIPIQHSMYSDIDIALIDNPANPGLEYRLGIVYKRWNGVGYSLMMDVHNVNISTGSIITSPILTTNPIAQNVPNTFLSTIRIDAVPSQTGTLVGGMTAEMDKFMLLYTRPTSESIVELYDHDGISIFPFIAEIVPFEGGKDVAAYVDQPTGDIMATVAVMDGNDVQVHEYNFSTTMLSAPTILSMGDVYYPYPRIEAYGYYDASASFAKWTLAASWMGTLYDEIRVFTDVSPMYIANAGIGDKHEYPTVAAGIGPVLSSVPASNIGNSQYSFA